MFIISAVCVTRVTIDGVTNGSTVDANTPISCKADRNAYPTASYRWTDNGGGLLSTDQEFVLEANTQYKLTCNASNVFTIQECYATAYIELNSKLTFIGFLNLMLYILK